MRSLTRSAPPPPPRARRSVLDYAPEGSEVRSSLARRLAALQEVADRRQADLLRTLGQEGGGSSAGSAVSSPGWVGWVGVLCVGGWVRGAHPGAQRPGPSAVSSAGWVGWGGAHAEQAWLALRAR
jgi:hypothetical protein